MVLVCWVREGKLWRRRQIRAMVWWERVRMGELLKLWVVVYGRGQGPQRC